MLLLASRTIQRFLTATVPPPQPDVRPEDWVRLGDIAGKEVEGQSDALVVQLYRVEPDPHMPYPRPAESQDGHGRAPLLLDLHYAIAYQSSSQESLESALGGVLRAFHTQSVLDPRDYLPASERQRAEASGLQLGRLDVSMESLEPESSESLWRGRSGGSRLALYYHVRAVQVPAFLDVRAPGVERVSAPKIRPLETAEGARP